MLLSSETPETGRLQEKMMLRMMASQATYIPAPCRRVKSMFVCYALVDPITADLKRNRGLYTVVEVGRFLPRVKKKSVGFFNKKLLWQSIFAEQQGTPRCQRPHPPSRDRFFFSLSLQQRVRLCENAPSLADLGGYLGSCTHGFRRQRCWLPPPFFA